MTSQKQIDEWKFKRAGEEIRVEVAYRRTGRPGYEFRPVNFIATIHGPTAQIVEATDIISLRKRVEELVSEIRDDEYEKVLIFTPCDAYEPNDFRDKVEIVWSVGFYVRKIDQYFKEDKTAESYRYMGEDFIAIPWTQEREDALRNCVKNIRKIREAMLSLRDAKKLSAALDRGDRLLTIRA